MKNKGFAKFWEGKQGALREMCKWRMSRAICRSKTIMSYLGKGLFLWLLDCLQPSIFVFQYFFFIHELGGSIHTKCEGVGRGACLFPITPVRLAHTSLDFLNVSSSFPRLWTSFLLNPYNLRMNDEARLGNTGMKPPQRYFRMVLFVLEHFT